MPSPDHGVSRWWVVPPPIATPQCVKIPLQIGRLNGLDLSFVFLEMKQKVPCDLEVSVHSLWSQSISAELPFKFSQPIID
jgi:hypothetical protein